MLAVAVHGAAPGPRQQRERGDSLGDLLLAGHRQRHCLLLLLLPLRLPRLLDRLPVRRRRGLLRLRLLLLPAHDLRGGLLRLQRRVLGAPPGAVGGPLAVAVALVAAGHLAAGTSLGGRGGRAETVRGA